MKLELKKIRLLFTAALFLFAFSSIAQTSSVENKIADLTEEKDELKVDLVRVQEKLRKNKLVKGIGIGLTGAGLFVWPALIPGIPMWVASPTKKWIKKEEMIEDRLLEVRSKIKKLRKKRDQAT